MGSEKIESQYQDEKDLYQYLMERNEVSFATYIDSVYKKVLLLSAASYFESEISKIIVNFAKESLKKDQRIAILIEKKVIERQYHTLFSWDANNTNSFWSLFGQDTKDKVRKIIKETADLEKAERAFLSIGNKRNLLVHQNFSEHDLNTTIDEIYNEYVLANKYVEFVSQVLTSSFIKG